MKAFSDKEWASSNVSVAEAREAQAKWALQPIPARLGFVRRLRHHIAAHAAELAAAAARVKGRPVAEKLASEVLPLADACRWLERRGARVLAPRYCGKEGRPFWMRGLTFEVQRRPFGVVLVIGPANYPLFLPAVQTLHALIAGNSVLLKPAPGALDVASAFSEFTRVAGLSQGLLSVLPANLESVSAAIAQGVDKVIFTGSSENGRDVLRQLASQSTPAVMELSGDDAVLIFGDADLDLVVRALGFGTRWNGGDTCIAPRRLFAVGAKADELRARLRQTSLSTLPLERVSDESAAVAGAMRSNFALGVSIFSRDVARARTFAARIKSGFVLINDLIVPTADPRMPFGGSKASGFGVTRGDEGLREMTFPHVVAIRQGKSRPHFEELVTDPGWLFSSYILAAHGEGWRRIGALRDLIGAAINEIKSKKAHK
ncbi:MAG: aldehyde dehydrogenase family protein [Verrucomicrobia bacterium]|nr:aldehyde dehydrogenase family protein [Verrucomicrobiota bacterium]